MRTELFNVEKVMIENVFGQMKIRFPILENLRRVKLDKVPKIVVACALLNNIAKHIINIFYVHERIDLYEDGESEDGQELMVLVEVELRRSGNIKRNVVLAV